MIVIATGISGGGKLSEAGGGPGYIVRLIEEGNRRIAQEQREGRWTSPIKRLRYLDMGSLMLQRAADLGLVVRTETILDMAPEALQELRAIAFTEVVNDPALWDPDLCTILVTHACFWWKGHLIPGLDTHYLKLLFDETRRRMPPVDDAVQETLPGLRLAPPVRPEGIFYATVVDSVYAIQRRLEETDQWRGRIETSELIAWQEQEVFISKMFAAYERVPHYLIAHDEPVQTLLDLICFKRPKIYIGYPITNLRREGNAPLIEMAREFGQRLRRHFVVFDPLSVKDEEAATIAKMSEEEFERQFSDEQKTEILSWAGSLDKVRAWGRRLDDHTRLQLGRATVVRDLRLIDQSDMNVVFYPTSQMSFGVLAEMIHAHTTGKKVYIVYPYKSISPFLEYYASGVFNPRRDEADPRTPGEIVGFVRRASDRLVDALLADAAWAPTPVSR
jgi:adenylate kinase